MPASRMLLSVWSLLYASGRQLSLSCYAQSVRASAMNNSVDFVTLLKPLFDANETPINPATEASLELFKSRTFERNIPSDITMELADFYSIVGGVPCLDSLDIHRCDDLVLFEWWDQ